MQKKAIVLLLMVFGVVINTLGEEQRKNYIGLNASAGYGDYSGTSSRWDYSYSYTGKGYFAVGIDYARYILPKIELCTGLQATVNMMDETSKYIYQSYSSTSGSAVALLSVPLHLKMHVHKYLFADAGVSFDYYLVGNATLGAGFMLGFGAEYVFDSGMSVFFLPKMQYSMTDADVLLLLGGCLGVGYHF